MTLSMTARENWNEAKTRRSGISRQVKQNPALYESGLIISTVIDVISMYNANAI